MPRVAKSVLKKSAICAQSPKHMHPRSTPDSNIVGQDLGQIWYMWILRGLLSGTSLDLEADLKLAHGVVVWLPSADYFSILLTTTTPYCVIVIRCNGILQLRPLVIQSINISCQGWCSSK